MFQRNEIFLFLVLGAFHKKQTRNVHQQHQKLFNIKMNVYEEKRVKQRMREKENKKYSLNNF
jgi:hypothetical protein